MNYYFLDKISWPLSQALYHAAAYLQHESLFILRPESPYVCIGFHQDAEQEIDLNFTAQNNIPVYRREVGGGAVYLDGQQLFYQLIINTNNPHIPQAKEEIYRQLLNPVVETYREFGVDAAYKPVNDIIANGKKVSGNGAAEINNMVVLVGNFILDFDYDTMSKCLRVPDEKFRDKVFKTLQENLSTFLRETGQKPDTRSLGDSLAKRYEKIFGKMEWKTEVEDDLLQKADELHKERFADDWLYFNDRRRPTARSVKIRDGVNVIQNLIKTPGGLVRVTLVNDNGILRDVHISGDFFFYPSEKLTDLEKALDGIPYNEAMIQQKVESFYLDKNIEAPGVNPIDIAKAIVPLVS